MTSQDSPDDSSPTSDADPLTDRDADKVQWDDRYDEHDQMWSGRPNGALEAEARKLAPGRALDVGCGEGADAIWLATQGWHVTGVDISTTAIDRAVAEATNAQVKVQFETVDVLVDPPKSREYDLVAISYPALRKTEGLGALNSIIDAVAPGGRFLAALHAQSDESTAFAKAHGFDPNDYVSADDILAALTTQFTIEKDAMAERPDAAPDAIHQTDRVIVARRVEDVRTNRELVDT